MEQFDLRVVLVVLGVLILATGIVTEVLKKVFWQSIPSSLLTIIVAEGLTLGAGLIYAVVTGATVIWYHVIAAVIAGEGVAFSAMFGYDKFIEIKRDFMLIKFEKNKHKI